MKLFVEIVLIAGVIGWALSKYYFQIDYGLVMAITLLAMTCYPIVLLSQPPKDGKDAE